MLGYWLHNRRNDADQARRLEDFLYPDIQNPSLGPTNLPFEQAAVTKEAKA
jgi:hypothetical protein